ncbi:DUF504 domain-containing protein [Candidatus Woesearchaeota archaeon]|nr:DUF504 domain-containing protein [Candidatus Woesearchaeota archaeon]
MVMREQDKHFLWSLFVALSVILLWKGLWEGMYEFMEWIRLPQLADPFVFLFLGLVMLTFSGIIFREFDPLDGMDKSANKIMHHIHNHPRRQEFKIRYYDKTQRKHFAIRGDALRQVERGTLIVEHENGKQEAFIPVHRVEEVLQNDKTYWKR